MDAKKGGPSEGIRQLQSEITHQNLPIECDIVCLDDDINVKENDYAKVISLGSGKGVFSYSSKLKKWLLDNICNYDVVIIHGLWQYQGYITSKICKKYSVPYIVYSHGMLDPWFKKTYPAKHIKKLIYWMLAEKNVINGAKAVVFTSEEEKILARDSFPFYKPNESVTAYGTAGYTGSSEIALSEFRKRFPKLADKKLILYVGRIHEKKGCDILINSFAELVKNTTEYHLFLAGPDDGKYALELKKLVSDLGIEEFVTWGGMISGEVKWGAYYSSQIFCLSSHQENFGIVVAEALSCSIPVVTTDKVNIWREIEGSNAGSISKDNTDSFTKSLIQFVGEYEKNKNQYKENALFCFKNNFDIKLVAKSFTKIIKD